MRGSVTPCTLCSAKLCILCCPNAWRLRFTATCTRRYKALSTLQLPWISQKRATILAESFVAGKKLPDVQSLCQVEPFAIPKRLLRSSIFVNASFEQLRSAAEALELHTHTRSSVGGPVSHAYGEAHGGKDGAGSSEHGTERGTGLATDASPSSAAAVLTRDKTDDTFCDALSAGLAWHGDRQYVLLPIVAGHDPATGFARRLRIKPRFVLALQASATSRDKLQAVLQAASHRHFLASMPASSDGARDAVAREVRAMQQALDFADRHIDAFESALAERGWNTGDVIMWSGQRHVLQV